VKFRKYKVHIKQAVRENGRSWVKLLEGITEVGLRIEKKD
jgi:ribosomal protein L20